MARPLMAYFSYDHLPEGLARDVSARCADLARGMNDWLPESEEKMVGLRKLLEAKDCFVRAALPDEVR